MDWETGTIWQIVADGVYLTSPLLVVSGLDHPEGLAVYQDESLLVVESGAGRLSRIELESGEKEILAENLALGAEVISDVLPPPWIFNGVAVGKSGEIYVTGDVGNIVYKITP